MVSAAVQSHRRGVWEPLPAVLYGHAIHPLSNGQQRDSLHDPKSNGGGSNNNGESSAANDMIVGLDVGDDVYAFERYVPKGKEVDGIWYRGSVFGKYTHPPLY